MNVSLENYVRRGIVVTYTIKMADVIGYDNLDCMLVSAELRDAYYTIPRARGVSYYA